MQDLPLIGKRGRNVVTIIYDQEIYAVKGELLFYNPLCIFSYDPDALSIKIGEKIVHKDEFDLNKEKEHYINNGRLYVYYPSLQNKHIIGLVPYYTEPERIEPFLKEDPAYFEKLQKTYKKIADVVACAFLKTYGYLEKFIIQIFPDLKSMETFVNLEAHIEEKIDQYLKKHHFETYERHQKPQKFESTELKKINPNSATNHLEKRLLKELYEGEKYKDPFYIYTNKGCHIYFEIKQPKDEYHLLALSNRIKIKKDLKEYVT